MSNDPHKLALHVLGIVFRHIALHQARMIAADLRELPGDAAFRATVEHICATVNAPPPARPKSRAHLRLVKS